MWWGRRYRVGALFLVVVDVVVGKEEGKKNPSNKTLKD